MLSLSQQNKWREKYRIQNNDWQPATEVFANLVHTRVQPETVLLDLGCGRGGLVEQLQLPLNQMIGLDPDWESLQTHRLAIPRAQGMSHALPFGSATFDIIFASWVLEHLDQPLATLLSIRRVLKTGGVFVFVTPNRRHPLAMLNRIFGRFSGLQKGAVHTLYHRAGDDTFSTYYRANCQKTLQQLGRQAGLTVTQLHHIPDPTYLAFSSGMYQVSCWFESRLPINRKIHLVGMMVKN